MRNVRISYRKDGACRYISHLDTYKVMMRALQMSGLPLWHTEGYNSRIYLSFPLPLSLGFNGECESLDVKLLQEDYPFESAAEKLNGCLPEGIRIYKISDPIMKPSSIAYGLFSIKLSSEELSPEKILAKAEKILSKDEILTEKKTKKGMITVDLKQNIVRYDFAVGSGCVEFNVTLPAGCTVNVNPMLIISVLEKECGCTLYADVTRKELYDSDFNPFE